MPTAPIILTLSLSLSLSLSIAQAICLSVTFSLRPYRPSLRVNPLPSIQCLHKYDECFCWSANTGVSMCWSPYEFFLTLSSPAMSACLSHLSRVCQMGSKWSYSCCFLVACVHFCSFLLLFSKRFVSLSFVTIL